MVHTAFIAPSREAVDAFYTAGLKAGGADAGPPGPRDIYGPGYYGACSIIKDSSFASGGSTDFFTDISVFFKKSNFN